MVTESVTGRRSLRRPGRRKRNGTPKAAAPSDARVTIKKKSAVQLGRGAAPREVLHSYTIPRGSFGLEAS